MSNILMIPASGSIIFDSQSANSSVISPLSAAPRLSYDNGGGLNITSYTTGTTTLDRFSVDGSAGRLFSISDSLTGTIFSVNDAAGLPIIQVDSDTTDIVNIGPYGTSTFVTSGTSVGIGTAAPISKLHIVDRALAATGGLFGSILNLEQTWNTTGTPTAIKLNVTDTTSNGSSKLLDLQINGGSKLSVQKNGQLRIYNSYESTNYAVNNSVLRWNSRYGPTDSNYGGSFTIYNSAWSLGVVNEFSFGNGGGAWSFYGVDYNSPVVLVPGYGGDFGGTIMLGQNARLTSDAANILAQRNGINPQAFRLYNTYTSSTNFERLNLRWDTNVVKIGTEKGSAGGTARDLVFETNATGRMTIGATGDITFSNPTQVRTALGFVQLTPSAYADLVASGIANPDTIYIVQE